MTVESQSPDAGRRPLLGSVFSDAWIVFRRVGGPRLTAARTVALARALRGALLASAGDDVPAEISGHEPSGKPLERPHVAYLGLPSVGHPHADGTLLGAALVLPRAIEAPARGAVLRAIAAWEERRRREVGDLDMPAPPLRLVMGRAGEIELERVPDGSPPCAGLDAPAWCRPALVWSSATPIALDRNPGDLRHGHPGRRSAAFAEAEESIASACRNVGLPAPLRIRVARSALLQGSPHPRHFQPFPPDPGRTRRVLVHARIEFADLVAGPVLLGAGRYLGLGLFRPHRSMT